MPLSDAPLFECGLISDVQHCDVEDGFNFDGSTARLYRGALVCLQRAVQYWNAHGQLSFVLNLGDSIDGRCVKEGQTESAIKNVMQEFESVDCRTYHLIGNHELYNFGREGLKELMNTAPPPRNKEFYSFSPHPEFMLIILDSYQLNVIRGEDSDLTSINAVEFLQARNPNDINPGGNWFKGLSGKDQRFVPFNGGFGSEQLAWLEQELAKAQKLKQRVVICSHVIVFPGACHGKTMAWDYEDALAIIHKHSCVVAVLCGHDHKGRHAVDSHGIHHMTLKSPLNRGSEGACFGHLQFHSDRIQLVGPELDALLPMSNPEIAVTEYKGLQVASFEFATG